MRRDGDGESLLFLQFVQMKREVRDDNRIVQAKVLSIVLRKFNSGYNRLAASDLDGRLASRLQCTCLGLDTRRTVRYRPAGGFSPLFLEKQVTRL